ncbi:MAG: LuxR C-terminal-related transcriptional regulator [Actinomycetes bacterium]
MTLPTLQPAGAGAFWPRPPVRPVLYGRAAELAVIDRLVVAARAGRGGALAIRGEPGIGKSALLAYADQRAGGLRVLQAVGVEGESRLAHAALQQLLHPLLGRVGQLPDPQARALGVAVGLEAGPPPDRFLVAMATLTLLSEAAEDRPLLCLVDDAHSADAPSLAVLGFVARRLETEPVALLVTLRDGQPCPEGAQGVATLHLAGLDAEASAALLRERWPGGLAPAVRRRLLKACPGNPLALLELPAALTPGQRAGTDTLEEPLPVAGVLEEAFLDRVRRHDPDAQTLLLLAAAEGGRLATVRGAARRLGLDPGGLESGRLAGLVRVDGTTLAFRHPLVRSAVYHGASPAARKAAHRALAGTLGDDQAARRAWHRAQATDGPDEAVAAELERAATQTLRRAGHAAAAADLEQAAELSPDDEDRARRLAAAATAAWRGGDTGGARALLDRAERLDPARPGVRLDIRLLRGSIELRDGIPGDGAAVLAEAAAQAVATDRRRAVPLLVAAAEAAFVTGQWETLAVLSSLAARLRPTGDTGDAVVLRLLASAAEPGGDPAAANPPAGGQADLTASERLEDPVLLGLAGQLAWKVGGDEPARALHAKAVERARMLGALGTLAWALESLSLAELKRDHYALAELHAREGLRMAQEAGHHNGACRHQSLLAHLSALRGREEETRRLAGEVLAAATARRLVREASEAQMALGLLALGAGRPADALEHLEALWAPGPLPGYRPIALYAVPDLVEAAVRAGQPDRCRDRLDAWLAVSDPARDPAVAALTARCRALVTTGPRAASSFEEALRLHAAAQQPFGHARTQLLYGEWLRRQRRRTQARPHLRDALEAFGRLGTPAWADRALRELRAAGETAGDHDPGALERLTPQELQIARGVVEGATNREIAAQLFVSPRTVSHHLRSVFSKLGISSRGELIHIGLAGDLEEPDSPLRP